MLSQFGGTSEAYSKASSMVFRMGTDAHLYDDPEDVSIGPLLESRFDSEKTQALKRLLALIAQGFDVSYLFPQVVKNVASQSLEVKKLAYLYLLHYAEKRPNEALLSINCFQKDLGDPNPLVRAWALRTMAGIRLHVIAPLVLIAVEKCARDPSVYVRKCAANALPKLHDLRQEENTKAIEEVIGLLLNDNSPGVVGAAASAFMSVCPSNLSLIGRNYRKLCETLPDVEEWGQIILIEILLRYTIARHGLVKESLMLSSCVGETYAENDGSGVNSGLEGKDGTKNGVCESGWAWVVSRSYLEGPEKYLSRSDNANMVEGGVESSCFTSATSNDDIRILLQCTSPLLWSHNSAVVLAAAGLHWIMAPKDDAKRIVKPLLFVLRSSSASRYVVLCNIQVFAKAMPHIFASYFEDFFVSSSDSYQTKALKLEILSSIATDSSISVILQEFQDYVRDPDRRFAADSIAAIGLCVKRLPELANTCLEGLLALIKEETSNGEIGPLDGEANVLAQVLISIREIVSLDPLCHEKAIIQLIRGLELIKVPAARTIIIWMVGEYNSIGLVIPRMLPAVLKYLAWRFTSESLETKLQILNTATKVLLCAKQEDAETFGKILGYVLELAKCDLYYDMRDRARALKKFISLQIISSDVNKDSKGLSNNKDLQRVVATSLLCWQTKSSNKSFSYRFYLPGSLSQLVFHAAPGYEPLPSPCSLTFDDTQGTRVLNEGVINSDSYEMDDSDSAYGSTDKGRMSECSSQGSGSGCDDESDSASENDYIPDPLINISDANSANTNQNGDDFGDLMSRKALESWLGPSESTSELSHDRSSSARISLKNIGDRIKRKSHKLLDPSVGHGLRVDYTFSSEVSNVSSQLVCVEVHFQNCSMEPFSKLTLLEEDSSTSSSSISDKDVPTLVPMEEINSLEASKTMKTTLQIRFHHHLLPLKLVVWCNGKKNPVKLRPDIGYFVKPLPMDVELFMSKESQLPGMFEYERSCIFTDHIGELKNEKSDNSVTKDTFLLICESLAIKMLSNANLFLVCVDMPVASNFDEASGLRLRFSCEILSSSLPCLITATIHGKCLEPLTVSIKVNCEETVFGLNLLNRIVNFLAEPVFTPT